MRVPQHTDQNVYRQPGITKGFYKLKSYIETGREMLKRTQCPLREQHNDWYESWENVALRNVEQLPKKCLSTPDMGPKFPLGTEV